MAIDPTIPVAIISAAGIIITAMVKFGPAKNCGDEATSTSKNLVSNELCDARMSELRTRFNGVDQNLEEIKNGICILQKQERK